MKNVILLICVVFIFQACNNSNEQTKRFEEMQENLTANKYPTIKKCYDNKNGISLQIEQTGIEVNGHLHYGKNKIGTVKGIQEGDTLKLEFEYTTDNKTSYEDKYFLINKEELLEAENPLMKDTADENRMIYQDIQSLNFNDKSTLQTVICE